MKSRPTVVYKAVPFPSNNFTINTIASSLYVSLLIASGVVPSSNVNSCVDSELELYLGQLRRMLFLPLGFR